MLQLEYFLTNKISLLSSIEKIFFVCEETGLKFLLYMSGAGTVKVIWRLSICTDALL
jgi:hypothetical protein